MDFTEELGRALELHRPSVVTSVELKRACGGWRVSLSAGPFSWLGTIDVHEVEDAYESNLLELFAEAWWERG